MNRILIHSAAMLLAALSFAPSAFAAGPMADKDGMILYTYDKDGDGKSACVKDCLKMWRPVEGKAEEKMDEGWTLVQRDDGLMQKAYKGHPVYHYLSDKAKGDALGEMMDMDGVTLHTMGQSGAFQTIKE
jgi:predicted lipoprotein with Yx(FWY)xxD motif